MSLKIVVLFSLLLPISLFSQTIQGVITNYEKLPIPFATIYIEELQTGTSANQQGKYEIHAKPGTYTLSFRAMGNSPRQETVVVKTENIKLDIELGMQSYILDGVTVRADAEDPAYSIMRKAIARTPGFINQAKSYVSEVYIKGAVKASKIPKVLQKRMEVNGQKPEVGVTYVNESLNRITFDAPNNYVQEVISVNNSFPMGENDVPVIQMISGSIYESQDDLYISPFAPNAFSHYNFEYDGLLQDGAWFIDKIKVIPKRKSKLLMEGYIYIVEDLWCMYSYDILLKPAYAELKMRQQYAPVKGNSYFPINLFVEAKISVLGVKAEGNYTTTIKYESVVINPQYSHSKVKKAIEYEKKAEETKAEEPAKNAKVEEIDKKLEDLYNANELSNRDMVEMQKLMAKKATILEESKKDNPLETTSTYKQIVTKEDLIRDSVYWDSIRPVPASAEEKISYQKVLEKEQKEDSTSTFVKALKIAAIGNYEWERSKTFHTYYPGLLALRNIGFNPVDGLQLKQSTKMRWRYDSVSFAEFKGMVGYAWEREQVFGTANLWITYNPMKRGGMTIKGGYLSSNFQENGAIQEDLSAVYNLMTKETYIKFYSNKYIEINNRIDVANGMEWFLGAKWQQTDTLSNLTNFSILYPNDVYDANIPVNQEITASNLNSSKTALFSTGISFTPKNYYKIEKGQKKYTHSKWPTFGLHYSYAAPVNKGYSQYHLINLNVNQHIDIYGVSNIYYRVKAGMYFNKENIHFSNFTHFKTIQETFTTTDFKYSFFLLNNYEYSTAKTFVEGHFQYNTQFLLLKRLPWVSNQLWTENLFLNYLLVEGHMPYYETGYSMGEIFFQGEIGVYTGFKGTAFHGVGVRAVFNIN